MKVGISLPIREMRDDLGAVRAFSPQQYDAIKVEIDGFAEAAGRDPATIGREAGVAVVGARQAEWRDRVAVWRAKGLTHLCLRTLGGGLDVDRHIEVARRAFAELLPAVG